VRHHSSRSSRFIRLATIGVVAYAIYLSLNHLYRMAYEPIHSDASRYALAVAVTLAYLPLEVWLVWSIARGERRSWHRWVLVAVAVAILSTVPMVGPDWVGWLEDLASMILLVLPLRWALTLYAAMIASTAPLTLALGAGRAWAIYFTAGMMGICPSLAVPVWLLAAVRRLQTARLAVATEAVVHERLRIDAELSRSLGAALETIATRGDDARALAFVDPSASARRLGILVESARRTLADARGLVRRYRSASAVAQVEHAAQLLTAAGIQTRVVLPSPPPTGTLPDLAAGELRSGVGRLLTDTTTRRGVIELIRQEGSVRVDVRGVGRHDEAYAG
jgi:two-component system sensor histidine kinase DesK